MGEKTSIKKLVILAIIVAFLLTIVEQVSCSATNYSDLQGVQQAYDISGVTALWDMGYTGSGMKIAMIDEGVDYTNPDLGGCLGPNCKVIGGWNFEKDNGDPMIGPNPTYHGTLLAGQMAANGSFKGIAYDAKILAYRLTSDSNSFEALEKAIDDGANVINFSYGFTQRPNEMNFVKGFEDPNVERIYEKAEDKGTLIFISPGNFGSTLLETTAHGFPIVHPYSYYMPVGERVSEYTTLSIGGYDVEANGGEVAGYSSIGPSLNGEMQPDMLSFVGYPVPPTFLPQFHSFGGTSCSAPSEGAVAALIKQAHPSWSALGIRAALMNTASVLYNKINGEPISVYIQGSGLINPVGAVKTTAFITPYEINMTATGLKPVDLGVKNIADATQTFTATVELTLGNYEYGQNQGLNLSLTATHFVVGPHSTATVTLLANANLNTLTKGSHEALIWFNNGTATLHVPVAIWNDLNTIWWHRNDSFDAGWNENLPPKLINVRTAQVPNTSNIAIDFTINRGTFDDNSYWTAEPYWSDYGEKATISIFDAEGHLIKTIFYGNHLLLGHYQGIWDGHDNSGQLVPNGTYTYVVSMPDTFNGWETPIVDTSAQVTGTITVKDGFKEVTFTEPQYQDLKYGPETPHFSPPPSDTITSTQPAASFYSPYFSFTVPHQLIIVKRAPTETFKPYTFTGTETVQQDYKLSVQCTYFANGEKMTPTYDIKVNPNGSFSFTTDLYDGYNYFDFILRNSSGAFYGDVSQTVFLEVDNSATTSITPTVPLTPTVVTPTVVLTPTFTVTPTINVIELQVGSPVFKVNGESMALDSPPIIENSRTLLPIRAVVEAMGGTVSWSEAEKQVTINCKNNSVILIIGNNMAIVNGAVKQIDENNPNVVPEIINGRTMLPLRFVAESLGCQVSWDDKTKTITITY